jgi:hypothetical protein
MEVKLIDKGFHLEAFGKCFYYHCEPHCRIDDAEDKGLFIRKAIDGLDKKINLYKYDLVVMPEMRNRENVYMVRYIYRFNQPRLYRVDEILAQPMNAKLSSEIRQMNVLVVDDITCSGSTLNEILRSLRIVNDDNNITIFSLIGRKDLMADSF